VDVQNAGPISKLGHDCRIVYSVISDIVSIIRDLCTNRLDTEAGRVHALIYGPYLSLSKLHAYTRRSVGRSKGLKLKGGSQPPRLKEFSPTRNQLPGTNHEEGQITQKPSPKPLDLHLDLGVSRCTHSWSRPRLAQGN
jgi:hypothetical protein